MSREYKLLYFLGAGAARPCGYLTTLELYHSFMGENANLALIQEFGESLNEVTKDGLMDIETLYTLVTSDLDDSVGELYAGLDPSTLPGRLLLNLLKRHEPWRAHIQSLQKAFDEARVTVLQFILDKFWDVQPDTTPHKELYIEWACRELGYENVSVFTTNYDISLERALTDFVPFTTGLIGDIFTPSELVPSRTDALRVIKLHGSLDLHRLRDGRIVRINYPVTPGPWVGEDEVIGPYLVPPQEGKVRYDEMQEGLLKVLEHEVADANAIAIIGSSLRDARLANTLSSASEECHILLACGSRSTKLKELRFPNHEEVTCVEEHFPSSKTRDWFTLQIGLRGREPEP